MAEAFPTGDNALSFSFPTHSLRVVMRDGEPWFVAADVCEALTIGNNRDATARLDDDEKGVGIVDTLKGPQELVIINESGLYSLILTSRKPEAKKFKKWVTSEVLPAIRKTGRYVAPQVVQANSGAAGVALPSSTDLLAREVAALTRELRGLSRKVITTQTKLVKSQERNLALIEGHMSGEEATATILRMEREGKSRAAIVAATGRNYNAVRQAIFKARQRGELSADAAAPQAELDLGGEAGRG
jgi:prophage antirepressor-like protein